MQAVLEKVQVTLERIVEVAALVVLVVELARGAGNGAEKKETALAQLRQVLPPDSLPGFIAPLYDVLAGFVIDAIVAFFNRQGFFTRS